MKNLRLTKLHVSLLAASLALSSTAFAANYKGEPANYKGEAMAVAPCPPVKMLRDGFYVGAQAGYDSYRVRLNGSSSDATDSSSFSTTLNATGWVGGLLAGYGQYFSNQFYLGGELFVNTSGASETNSGSDSSVIGATTYAENYSSKVSVGTSWGISLLPGYKVNDTSLLYVRLGYNQANIKTSSTATVTATTAGVTTNLLPPVSASNNKWRGGFNYGVGLETLLADNLSGRIEYTHTNFNSYNVGGVSVNPSDNQGMLALIYHFA